MSALAPSCLVSLATPGVLTHLCWLLHMWKPSVLLVKFWSQGGSVGGAGVASSLLKIGAPHFPQLRCRPLSSEHVGIAVMAVRLTPPSGGGCAWGPLCLAWVP